MKTQKILSANIKSASYAKNQVLQNVELEIASGELTCICGPNGSGKSTLLSALAAVTSDSLKIDGSVLLSGTDVSKLNIKDRAKKIAFMEQSANSIWNFNVLDFVMQGRFPYSKSGYYSEDDRKIARTYLSLLGIESFANRNVHELSGGEFQKVRIARALTQTPDFILLDEPAANLDFVYEPQLLAELKRIALENNIGVVITIHDVNTASHYADKLVLLSRSQSLIAGPVKEVLTVENLNKTFGVNFECKEIKYFQSSQ